MLNIDKSWDKILNFELYNDIIKLLHSSKIQTIPNYSNNKLLLPFTFFKLSELKIVILGQDPYSNIDLATGLAFSVPKNIRIPPTLNNIFKEINIEYNNKYDFKHGDLTELSSREKILLLNTSLTVKPNQSIHSNIWEKYTDIIIQEISNNTKNVCFVLFGKHAQRKKILIDKSKHFIVESIHPSPQIAYSGFFHSNIFKKIEKYVGKINWQN